MEYLISVIKDPLKNSSVLLTLGFFLLLKSGLHEFSSKNKRVEPFKVINQSVFFNLKDFHSQILSRTLNK